ncbi:MAG: efflux RND transporter periplasmic adaptor subunit [Maricaulis sp.]|nr:efflux RND transporter periplasmic adaptor subunit [Maricaulis sp.]MDG2043672.1 efflux RND transporter periplasmic adaptor subunit [Maricaulis sp.]
MKTRPQSSESKMPHFPISLRSILASVLVLGLAPAASAQNAPPPAIVRTAEIVERNMARTITTPASVVSRNDARIAAEATGRITFIAEPGDRIEAGGIIAQMDNRQASILLEEARARLARVTANTNFQSSEVERLTRLAANGTVATTRLRDVELARDIAVQDRREARSAVARAELALERTQIIAPFGGRMVERLIQVGELSAPGREIARLVDTDRKEAIAQAPVAIAPFLAIGQDVMLSTSAGETMRAPIRAIIPVGDAISRTFEVRVDLAGSNWVIGSAARVSFPAEMSRSQFAAPYDSVILRANGASVFTVDADNIAHQVAVTAGVRDNGYIAISGDIEAGQRVVTSGAETLSEGRPVQELEEES